MRRTGKIAMLVAALLGAGLAVGAGVVQGNAHPAASSSPGVRGGATTIVEGGTGAPDFTPLLTKLAFHWDGEAGSLECLALAPARPAGEPGSGEFNTNVMYVTGPVTSGRVTRGMAVLEGTATVTGVGAGEDEPFRLTVQRGGPGTTAILEVSGLVFREIVLEGQVSL